MDINIKDLTPEQIADLEAQIAEYHKAKEHKPLAWKPKCDESYKVVGGYNGIHHPKWTGDEMDNGAYEQGNCFPTEELAEVEIERRKVIREIEELVDKYDSERGGAFIANGYNGTFMYDTNKDMVQAASCSWLMQTPLIPHFSSKYVAQCVLDEVGEDRVKLLFTKYPIARGDE